MTSSLLRCMAEGSPTARSSTLVSVAEPVHQAPLLLSAHAKEHASTKEQVPERRQERTYLSLSHLYLLAVSIPTSYNMNERRGDLRVNVIVLVHRSRSSGGSLDRRGSNERHQPREGDSDELHGSVLAGTVVVVVCGIESVEGLIVEKGGAGR